MLIEIKLEVEERNVGQIRTLGIFPESLSYISKSEDLWPEDIDLIVQGLILQFDLMNVINYEVFVDGEKYD